ncbi:major facilitator superfamily protein [Luminiphilus syltensis NOR5-1B]|uniref:Major facilitator superfamily protein n=1 Tax=Luminiphilus syltensis NOR5-1B TaxID=565045 RepID=B8KRC8_9GAMM|nr:MFS transporter [Luminiphilus syltensis]EED34748.1 major facilitator superfamily protein [Luminiphilus syltensis NOR5-1B]
MSNETGTTAQPSSAGYPSARTAWYVTAILTAAYIFSFIDRQILNLMVSPIQADLDLSDTEISLLQGLGFVATYLLLSIPIGRLVDTRSRINIIAGGIAIWSVATAACGLARSFTGLFIARAGVGIGEATLTPAAWSLIADYFPLHRRSLPFSIFLTGPYVGVGIAMVVGSWALDFFGQQPGLTLPFFGTLAPWQLTFLVVAAPGILLTLLVLLIKEPRRQGMAANVKPEAAPISTIVDWVRSNLRIYLALLFGVPCIVLVLYGLQAWVPTYLLRVQGMSLSEAGTQYGIIALIAGSLGVLSGPIVARALEARGHTDSQLRVAMIALALMCPAVGCLAIAPTQQLALASIAVVSYLVPLPLALLAAAIQAVTPNQMRGVLVGIYVVSTNIIGLAFGPTLVALTTDYIFQDPAAVGKSLAVVGCVVAVIGMILVGRGLAPYRKLLVELEAADS